MHGIVIPFISEVLFLQFNGVSQVKYIIGIAKSHTVLKTAVVGGRSKQRIVKTGINKFVVVILLLSD